jgi:hypothetical protein
MINEMPVKNPVIAAVIAILLLSLFRLLETQKAPNYELNPRSWSLNREP